MPGVLVFTESSNGKLKKASREALSIGRTLANAAGGDLVAFATDAAAAEDAGRYGAKKLYVANAGAYSTESHTAALAAAVKEANPAILLFGGTSNGRDLAPRVAARLDAGVASDVDRLEWIDGKLRARRPVYSGKAFATVEVSGTPAIATTRPNAFPAEEAGGGAAAEVVNVSFDAGDARVKLVDTHTPEAGEMSLAEADIIVSGGRGLKEATNFSYIRDLAHAIGGAVGASRATVDAGWIDHQHQVGQTGRVVSPNVYIAAGVSGAIQHLAGMSSSKHIVAINKDPEAPIFRVADLGVVGDLFQILPALTEEVKKAKAH
ncbi:MAG: electron transfer flavoprotein subunit alpha/FixB family protein [Acidobacteria bacterium]|nr:electron transfer flavoprotein subunit alpha/FixB family protein [Acidobacteriota bacterium]MBV9476462.1 electron transfer flavoprotein subunit alpha/FixB family protein [Acidobacteriota bacterium]